MRTRALLAGVVLAASVSLAGCTTTTATPTSTPPTSRSFDVYSDPQVFACAQIANEFDAWRVESLVPLGEKLKGGPEDVSKDDMREVRNSMVTVWQSLDAKVPSLGSDPAGPAWAGVVTGMRTFIKAYDDGTETEQYQALTAVAKGGESATGECSGMLDRKGG